MIPMYNIFHSLFQYYNTVITNLKKTGRIPSKCLVKLASYPLIFDIVNRGWGLV